MLTSGLLEKIGFSDEQIKNYNETDKLYGSKIEEYSAAFMLENKEFKEVVEKLHGDFEGRLHKFTANLLFVLHCTEFVRNKYVERNLDEELFFNMAKDIRFKLNECESVYKVFGIEPVSWYMQFFLLNRFAVGRLQYDVTTYAWDKVVIDGFEIEPQDGALGCHIPSGSRLSQDACLESYKMAYKLFPQCVKNGVLVIRCASWLLYPEYLPVFGENSNTGLFARNFNVFDRVEDPEFKNCWRVFGIDYTDDIPKYPLDTTMRRNFAEYIKNGGSHGVGKGVILFDGEKILTNH